MKVCVLGLWHLGTVTAAALASVKHEVIGLDFDEKAIQDLAKGIPPILEPDLKDLVRHGLDTGLLRFTTKCGAIPDDTEVLWVAYDTPVDENDVADVDFVVDQVERVLPYLPNDATVLVSSQMPVGSIRRLESMVADFFPEKGISFACSPENLRLGKALDVFLHPDRVIVGVRSAHDKQRIGQLLQPITDHVEWMSVESAEMTKHAINAFLAISVVFANEIASICEMEGADAKEVERGLKTEQRIGPKAYLSPGGAFAGGTLARDIEFLKEAGAKHHLTTPLLKSVRESNDQHKHWVRRKLVHLFPSLRGISIAVWGLTYKPGTDTLRRSLSVELCNWLIAQGARLMVHDPVVKILPANWGEQVQRYDVALDSLAASQALVVGTEWPEYKDISSSQIGAVNPDIIIIDPNRFLGISDKQSSLQYIAVGTATR